LPADRFLFGEFPAALWLQRAHRTGQNAIATIDTVFADQQASLSQAERFFRADAHTAPTIRAAILVDDYHVSPPVYDALHSIFLDAEHIQSSRKDIRMMLGNLEIIIILEFLLVSSNINQMITLRNRFLFR
jgi:hypothetical protein